MQPIEFKIKSFRINKITRKMLQKVLDVSIFECYPGTIFLKQFMEKQMVNEENILMIALYDMDFERIKSILKQGFDVNEPYNKHGWTPFMWACKEFYGFYNKDGGKSSTQDYKKYYNQFTTNLFRRTANACGYDTNKQFKHQDKRSKTSKKNHHRM